MFIYKGLYKLIFVCLFVQCLFTEVFIAAFPRSLIDLSLKSHLLFDLYKVAKFKHRQPSVHLIFIGDIRVFDNTIVEPRNTNTKLIKSNFFSFCKNSMSKIHQQNTPCAFTLCILKLLSEVTLD